MSLIEYIADLVAINIIIVVISVLFVQETPATLSYFRENRNLACIGKMVLWSDRQ